ncbi:MAG TPA: enoyl-CoA hydratase/isomerase family protein [Blastocatellia bacterium]|nr:enoyl-CoA hydratase/isomerase family protein [Blastocatellia bacterium]
MTRNAIQIEITDNIAVLTIDRPSANAIDLDTAREFADALSSLVERNDIGALIVTGAGKCLSAGLDLKVIPTYDRNQQQAMVMEVNRLFGRLYDLPFPTIAAVNGHAIAGGVILTLACDYRIGAEGDYKLGLAEMRVGVPFPVAALAIVQSELSHRAARLMVLTARNLNPREALSFGVLDELQPPERLLDRAMEVAREMAALPRATYARIKRDLRAHARSRVEDAIENRNEPMLESWLGAETIEAASEALKKK